MPEGRPAAGEELFPGVDQHRERQNSIHGPDPPNRFLAQRSQPDNPLRVGGKEHGNGDGQAEPELPHEPPVLCSPIGRLPVRCLGTQVLIDLVSLRGDGSFDGVHLRDRRDILDGGRLRAEADVGAQHAWLLAKAVLDARDAARTVHSSDLE